MSTRFILVRHGETPSSVERRFAGATDVPLTDTGREQALALARRLRQIRTDVLFCSPMRRCLQTAEPIVAATGRQPDTDDRLRECHFGDWEDLTAEEVLRHDREGFMRWLSEETARPPNGESWAELGSRVKEWFEEAAARYEDRTVLAVTHGGVIMWLSRHIAHAPYQALVSFEIDPCSITVVGSRGSLWRIRHLNDTTHIRDPLLEGPPPKPMPP